MRIAVLRNTPGARVLERRGRANREYYREEDVEAVRDILREAGHEAEIVEADVDLIASLERFFAARGPADGRGPFVFNMAYGVQGECRYTHVPSALEQAGVPYTGSGPHAHTVCLDKYLTKIVLARAGLPTPRFELFRTADQRPGEKLAFPLIVKPQFESTSFGLRVVADETEMRRAVQTIIDEFRQPALVEAFIEGTEVNCGVVGNAPPEAFPVLEIDFGGKRGAEAILSHETKRDRKAGHICPARLAPDLTARVQELAVQAFAVLGCFDSARVDFRIDAAGCPQILELNSMVAIHRDASLYHAARTRGMSYPDMILKLLDAAVRRYGCA
jgi:D-alanine-D-alanine ligase